MTHSTAHARHFLSTAAKLAWFFSCALALAACQLDRKGMVMLTDASLRSTVAGTNADGFMVPDGILWRKGRLIMADEGGHAVRLWSSASEVRTLCDSTLGIKSPEDLVMDEAGNLFFTDDDAGGVWEVDRNGNPFLLAGESKGLVSTEGIALAPWGQLLVGDGRQHEIFSVSMKGDVSVFLGPERGITKPESMVFDEKGDLYIADNEDRVLYLLTKAGKLERVIEGRDDFSPETIWYAHHVLYITDSENGKLSSYTPEEGLKSIAVFGGELGRVSGVTTDEEGSIYVSVQTDLARRIGYILKLERELPRFRTASR